MDQDIRDLERRAREGDLRAMRELERRLARSGQARVFDPRSLLSVLPAEGREALYPFGEVSLAVRRVRDRVMIRAFGSSLKTFTSWLPQAFNDDDFIATARRLYARALQGAKKPAIASPVRPLAPIPVARTRREIQEDYRKEIRRARFLRRVLGS